MKNTWGIFDTQDLVWIGNDSGPRLFPQKQLADVAALVVDAQLGTSLGRHRSKKYKAKTLRLRDEVKVKMTPVEALEKLENGLI